MRLHLHVGHGKTGSSFLQSWWSLNRSELWRLAGLHYPVGPTDKRASQGAFGMGNGALLDQVLHSAGRARQQRRLWAALLRDSPGDQDNALKGFVFSAERWARHLPLQFESLLRLADEVDVDRIRVFMLVRDPLDHALSLYGQMVKRHGFTGSLDDWLASYNFSQALLNSLKAFKSRPDRIELHAVHYGRHRQQLVELMQDWLQLPSDAPWRLPMHCSVNRSLNADELMLMRALNRRYGDRAAIVGEALVDRLPNLAPARLQPSAAAAHWFVQSWGDVVEQINLLLPRHARLRLVAPEHEEQDPPPATSISLLPEQLDCVLDGLQRLMLPVVSR